MEDHRFTFDDRRWLWRYSPLKGSADGWTDYENHKILIHSGLTGRRKFEIELHEGLHAAFGPTLSEESVTQAAKDLARAMWKLYKITPREEG